MNDFRNSAKQFEFWKEVSEEREKEFGELSEKLDESLTFYEETMETKVRQRGARRNQWLEEELQRVRSKRRKIEREREMKERLRVLKEENSGKSDAIDAAVEWIEETRGKDSLEALEAKVERVKLLHDQYKGNMKKSIKEVMKHPKFRIESDFELTERLMKLKAEHSSSKQKGKALLEREIVKVAE